MPVESVVALPAQSAANLWSVPTLTPAHTQTHTHTHTHVTGTEHETIASKRSKSKLIIYYEFGLVSLHCLATLSDNNHSGVEQHVIVSTMKVEISNTLGPVGQR